MPSAGVRLCVVRGCIESFGHVADDNMAAAMQQDRAVFFCHSAKLKMQCFSAELLTEQRDSKFRLSGYDVDTKHHK